MALGNDERGWVMAGVSGVACVVGASIIYSDLIIQQIPKYRDFQIQDSSTFLAASLSLSFGVMLFSSLSSMYPESQRYLERGGVSNKASAYITIGCFLGGVIGIAVVSRFLHHYIPSHVVDCDHTHEGEEMNECDDEDDDHHHTRNGSTTEHSPLISKRSTLTKPTLGQRSVSTDQGMTQVNESPILNAISSRRPSMPNRPASRVTTFLTGAKHSCDEVGPCYGYTDVCGRECYKIISRSPTRSLSRGQAQNLSRQGSLARSSIGRRLRAQPTFSPIADEESVDTSPQTATFSTRPSTAHSEASSDAIFRGRQDVRTSHNHLDLHDSQKDSKVMSDGASKNEASQHHHHVPSNAFMAIGLQTSIAIALHKLPEGFITYATNHANPKLGFSVFMALFIHNITEGFALALPLYLALNSRWRAMLWASLLGGISQPLGAGVAALWFRVARQGSEDGVVQEPGDTVYGCMFAITAGIMASVALQLFEESMTLVHSRQVCMAFAFTGMGILGLSHALTAGG